MRAGAALTLSIGLFLSVAACNNASPASAPGSPPGPAGPVEGTPAMTATMSSAAMPTAALAPEGTLLRQIQDRGKLICGTKIDVPTFGYLNPDSGEVEGFEVEVCKAIAAHVFGDPGALETKEADLEDRIPMLNDGRVDVLVSTMTITADRLKAIDFSDVYYVAGQSLLVPADSAIASVDDLQGKAVGTVKGTTSETNLAALSEERGLGVDVVLFDTLYEAVPAMDAGRVEAVTADDVILYGFVGREPEKWKVVGGQLSAEPYGVGVKKGEAELLQAVNAVVHDLKTTGKWQDLYAKWIPAGAAPAPPPDDWETITAP
jgi:putative glutamine transport system substrate-binding protein